MAITTKKCTEKYLLKLKDRITRGTATTADLRAIAEMPRDQWGQFFPFTEAPATAPRPLAPCEENAAAKVAAAQAGRLDTPFPPGFGGDHDGPDTDYE